MTDSTTSKHTVTTNEEFIEELLETYSAANTASQALICAAQDGVQYRQAISGDLECYVRELVRDELETETADDVATQVRADD